MVNQDILSIDDCLTLLFYFFGQTKVKRNFSTKQLYCSLNIIQSNINILILINISISIRYISVNHHTQTLEDDTLTTSKTFQKHIIDMLRF